MNDEIKKVEKLYKYIKLEDSKSFLSEKIAENYYKLGMLKYSKFLKNEEKENFSTNLSTISKIIEIFEKCYENYKQSKNNKLNLKKYENIKKTVNSKKALLLGNENFKNEKYEEALKNYENIECNDPNINEEKKNLGMS